MRNNRGAAYVLALVSLVVGTVLGLAMLRASSGYFLAERSQYRKQAAMDLAEAGIDYALWQVHCKQARLPFSTDVALGGGSFHVDVTDDGARDQSTILITSSGTCSGQMHTVKKVALGVLPYGYCWCENVGVDDGDILITSDQGRGIRSNGSIKLTNAATNIPAGGWANTTFSGAGIVSPQYTYTPKIRYPDIDFSYYASIATKTYYGSGTLNSTHFQGEGGVILVYGDVSYMQNITYTGAWIVVVTHDISIGCSVTAANANSYLAIISGHDVDIYTSGSFASDRLDAVVYAPYGNICLRGTHYYTYKDNDIYINGSMACSNFSTSGDGGTLTVRMAYDPRLTLYVLRDRLKLPGL